MKDFMQMYSGLVERCFNDCAHDMSSAKLKWVRSSPEQTYYQSSADGLTRSAPLHLQVIRGDLRQPLRRQVPLLQLEDRQPVL